MKYLIKNAKLWTGREQFDNGCVMTDGGRIVYAGDALSAPAFTADETIDAKGGIVSPAFYSAHNHAAMSLMRGEGSDLHLMDWLQIVDVIEKKLDWEAVYIGSMLSCMEMLRGGCVCFNDMYILSDATAQAANDSGMRAAISRGTTDMSRFEENIRLYDKWHNKAEGRIHIGFGPYAEYGCDSDMYRMCIDEARRRDTFIHTHASESQFEVGACKERHNGLTPVRWLNEMGFLAPDSIVAHCVWIDEEEIGLLAKSGVHVSHCPSSNCKLGNGIAPVVKLLESGADVSLGLDGPSSSNIQDMQAEARLMALMQKTELKDPSVMKAADCMRIACENGARACSFPNAGVLRENVDADLVIWNAGDENLRPVSDIPSALIYAARSHNVRMTFCAGNIVYREGEFPMFDAGRMIRESGKVISRLMS